MPTTRPVGPTAAPEALKAQPGAATDVEHRLARLELQPLDCQFADRLEKSQLEVIGRCTPLVLRKCGTSIGASTKASRRFAFLPYRAHALDLTLSCTSSLLASVEVRLIRFAGAQASRIRVIWFSRRRHAIVITVTYRSVMRQCAGATVDPAERSPA